MAPNQQRPGGSAAALLKLLNRAQRRARRLLDQPEELIRLVQQAERRAPSLESGPLAGVLDELKAALRLLRAFARGDYRNVSWKSLAVMVGAVLYVVSPIDFIPDFLPLGGVLDDATILGFALRRVHQEIEAFLEWERATGRGPEPGDAP